MMKKITMISTALLAFGLTANSQVTQLGTTISGSVADQTGRAVAISENDSTLAVSDRAFSNNRGRVRLFKFENGDWVPKGSPLEGLTNTSFLVGADLDLTADGNTLILGAPQAMLSGSPLNNVGAGRVYTYDDVADSWTQKGGNHTPFNGFQDGNYTARSVAISNGGNIAHVASYTDDDAGNEAGAVYSRFWTGTQWNGLGGGINRGDAASDWFGYNIDAADNLLVVGVPQRNNSTASGKVEVYEFMNNGWSLKGSVIEGPSVGSLFGFGVRVSADGNTFLAGAVFHDASSTSSENGYAACYEYDGTDWVMKGSPFIGLNAGDRLGFNPAINKEGNLLAIGAHGNDSIATDAGMVTVYYWDGTDWEQVGDPIFGAAAGHQFGYELSMDGNILAVGGFNAGEVKTYKIEVDSTGNPSNPGNPTSISEIKMKKIAVYPNPASDVLNLTTHDAMEEIQVYDNSGRLVLTTNALASFQNQIDVSKLNAGTYFVNVKLENGELISEKILLK